MEKLSKKSENVLKNIKPYQEHLKKRRREDDIKKQETNRILFIKNEIERHKTENDEKCRLFIKFHKEISNEEKTIPERKLLLSHAIDIFSQICIDYPEIKTAFFEAQGAEGLALSFEMLLDAVVYNLLLEMFSTDAAGLNSIFHNLLTHETPEATVDELQP